MEPLYYGIIIEEALDDNLLINDMIVEKIYITRHKKREDRWHMYQVKTSLDKINELADHIIDDWYIHFWNGSDIIALFSGNRQFHFNYENKETWKDVLEYGRSIGIPEEQLDFPIREL